MRLIAILAALMFTSAAFACGGHDGPKTAEESEGAAPVAANETQENTENKDQAAPKTDEAAPKTDDQVAAEK